MGIEKWQQITESQETTNEKVDEEVQTLNQTIEKLEKRLRLIELRPPPDRDDTDSPELIAYPRTPNTFLPGPSSFQSPDLSCDAGKKVSPATMTQDEVAAKPTPKEASPVKVEDTILETAEENAEIPVTAAKEEEDIVPEKVATPVESHTIASPITS